MKEQRDQDDDRDWHTQKEKQKRTHADLLSLFIK